MAAEYDGPVPNKKMSNFLVYKTNDSFFSKSSILIVKDNQWYFLLHNLMLNDLEKNEVNLSKFSLIKNYYFSEEELSILKAKFKTDFFLKFNYEKNFFFQNTINGDIVFYNGDSRTVFNNLGVENRNSWVSFVNNFPILFYKDIDNSDLSYSINFSDFLPEVQKSFKKRLSLNKYNYLSGANNKKYINTLMEITPKKNDKPFIQETNYESLSMTEEDYNFKENFFISKNLRIDFLNISAIKYNNRGYTYFYIKNTDLCLEFSSSEITFNIISDYYTDYIIDIRKQSRKEDINY